MNREVLPIALREAEAMSVAYTAIPLAEPDETHIDYSSIHTFRRSSFSSIFTYRTVAGADESSQYNTHFVVSEPFIRFRMVFGLSLIHNNVI